MGSILKDQAVPVRKLGYVPQLDGLRAVGVAMAMLYHLSAKWAPGGWLALDLFFVLSGFLITSLMLQEHARTGTIDYGRFLLRRLIRLYPALIALLIGVTIWAGVEGITGFWTNASYTIEVRRNLVDMGQTIHHLIPNDALGPTWSLAMEDQFYLVWPLGLILALKFLRRRGVIVLVTIVALASLVDKIALYASGASQDRLFFGPDCCVDLLLIGCAAGLLFVDGQLDRFADGRFARFAPPIVVGGLVMSTWFVAKSRLIFAGPTTVIALAFAVMVVGLALAPKTPVGRLLAWKPLVKIGEWSYSLYLWHTLAYMIRPPGGPIAKVALAFVFGVTSFYVIERPARALGRFLLGGTSRRVVQLVAAGHE